MKKALAFARSRTAMETWSILRIMFFPPTVKVNSEFLTYHDLEKKRKLLVAGCLLLASILRFEGPPENEKRTAHNFFFG